MARIVLSTDAACIGHCGAAEAGMQWLVRFGKEGGITGFVPNPEEKLLCNQ
jgi:hypothetical protein